MPNKEKFNIPSNIKEHLSQNDKVNTLSDKNEHKSTYSSDINVPSETIVDIPQTVIDNQHKNMNIPPGNVDIPSSETNLPNYNPKLYYYYNNDLIRRKITLKIDPGNDKEILNIVINKTKRISIFDIKKYVMEQKHEYTYDRQTIKYIGEVLSKKDITFKEMNCKRDIVLDIVIVQIYLQSIVNDKILIDKIYHNNSSLIGKKCLNKQSNEIVIIVFLLTEIILWHTPKE